VLALLASIAKLGNGGGGVSEQALFEGGIGPGFRDYARAVPRTDLVLVGIDQSIERRAFDRDAEGNLWVATFGGGLEWKVTDNVSIRGDYRFTDLDNFSNDGNFHCDFCEDSDFRNRNDVNVNVQRVLFTLNWRFGGFGETTAAAY
jgi:opacity protein-like surface antigen